ncbi:ABC transporter permease [Actinomadura barringtoniae]|uniref:ABC transporter permease n=1 Tax=Actinomadura barringtoniae TaxID=1427535 RepID=A0A939PA91_9ACTN|nr:ABC transporter permease [Actinomadura barringtoniae]MBO2448916.1 ABC transporter permease [Actinomadura barringtoniae]
MTARGGGGALGRVVRAGVGRRRVQTVVMALTMMMAVTASVLAAGLVVASQGPFDHAFGRQNGAHLTAGFDGAKVTDAELKSTSSLPGVTATAGPYPVLTLRPVIEDDRGGPPLLDDGGGPPMTIVGRTGPGGAVDRVDLTDGHWATGKGQVVLNAGDMRIPPGSKLTFPDLPGRPTLAVVGTAKSVSESADAWVSPEQLEALAKPGTAPGRQMLYRFRAASTEAQLNAARASVAAAVPPGALTDAASYLKVKVAAQRTSGTFVPFVVAFGLLGMVMSVLIIGVVVSGAVGAATRRIGILKALGFTPSQVVRAYVGQALLPALVGTLLGVVLANLLAIPVMHEAEDAYGTGSMSIAPWISIAVPLAALVAVAATAFVPALRAGRLRTAQAIAVGRTTRTGRGRSVRHLLGRLPGPRPLSLGLADPFARPARSATMAVAVILGTVGVTFCAGLALSLNGIQNGMDRRSPGAVIVHSIPPPGAADPKPADPAAVAAKISALPGTRRFFSVGQLELGAAGLARRVHVNAYSGAPSWGSYQMISGRWFRGPGEAVVPTGFLNNTGTHVGDTITLTNEGRRVPVRVVGEAFDLSGEGMTVLTPASSLNGLNAKVLPGSEEFNIDLKPGYKTAAYVDSLNQALQPLGINAQANSGEISSTLIAMDSLAGILTVMLVSVAGMGVLNTVVLDTRERVHDLGVFKALGMSPRQTILMVITSVTGIGLVAGAIGVPIGMALHGEVLPAMGDAADITIPPADLAVYDPPVLIPLLLGGLVIATAGALLPATWTARIRTATALRTE